MRPLPAPPRSPGPPADRRTSGDDQAPHADAQGRSLDVEEALDVLLRDLRTSRGRLSSAEAQRRSLQYGTNELQRRERVSWPREVAAQLTQPLWVAAGLEFAIGNSTVAIAVMLVIMINATMALFQERHHFDPRLKLMSTADRVGAERRLHTMGAPEEVLSRFETVLGADGHTVPLDESALSAIDGQVHGWSTQGMRLIAIARRPLPEAKLRIADALKGLGHIVAMTGDGVNDAPAVRAADIGVAMGRSGTDVAREAAPMVLTDDNFATIHVAIKAGRAVYDNVRKFIIYIFAHATPETVPSVVFALSGSDPAAADRPAAPGLRRRL